MKAATIHEIKQELTSVPPAQLIELCLRLARFKKENKELLTYLLFEAFDEAAYIGLVKKEIDENFELLNLTNLYFVKKGLRKIVRTITKYIRYTGSKQVEVELLLYFCTKLKDSDIPIQKNTLIDNLYQSQLKKVHKVLETMHEDLQYEYARELERLES
ncbi:MAG TPA: hypothetical protein VJ647_05475 [Chitinophagaceae bacterium]|nr:hypothetical protein [Chitinophagaceae bacterium]